MQPQRSKSLATVLLGVAGSIHLLQHSIMQAVGYSVQRRVVAGRGGRVLRATQVRWFSLVYTAGAVNAGPCHLNCTAIARI